jgi:CDP-diglyceride synthetase
MRDWFLLIGGVLLGGVVMVTLRYVLPNATWSIFVLGVAAAVIAAGVSYGARAIRRRHAVKDMSSRL